MNRSITIVAIGAAALLCRCGQQTQNEGTVINLKNTTAGPNFAPLCDASLLSAYGMPRVAGKLVNVDIVITNKSSSKCTLDGLPNAMQDAVRLVRNNGSVIRTQVVTQDVVDNLTIISLKPHGRNEAHLSVDWGNWCNAKPGNVSFRIAFPYNKGVLVGAFNSLHGRTYVPA